MERAIEAGTEAGNRGEIPVGAVVLAPEGQIIAIEGNRREELKDPSAHAEIRALRAASAALDSSHCDGCTLVVTLEPCTMCAGAIQLARIKQVVFGAWEPKTGACGSQRDVLRDQRATHQVQVRGGVRKAQCEALLKGFFAALR
ncbi:nucleoside deaminase [Actinomyces vulturis]|uniref:nucleoside deaminase n=1 Tax=Actinomyces vulturis TaxID=1857645 RepID=UPI000834F254|nr:nucleoside deaminase [Actinomyces vulturis]